VYAYAPVTPSARESVRSSLRRRRKRMGFRRSINRASPETSRRDLAGLQKILVLAKKLGEHRAFLFYFGTGLHPIWWLLWLAPIPAIAVAPRLSSRAAFLLGVVARLMGALNQWGHFKNEVELPPLLIAVSLLVPAVFFGLGVFGVASPHLSLCGSLRCFRDSRATLFSYRWSNRLAVC